MKQDEMMKGFTDEMKNLDESNLVQGRVQKKEFKKTSG
jgi:hypothetical protein